MVVLGLADPQLQVAVYTWCFGVDEMASVK